MKNGLSLGNLFENADRSDLFQFGLRRTAKQAAVSESVYDGCLPKAWNDCFHISSE